MIHPAGSGTIQDGRNGLDAQVSYRDRWSSLGPGSGFKSTYVQAAYGTKITNLDSWDAGLLLSGFDSSSELLSRRSAGIFGRYIRKLMGDAYNGQRILLVSAGASVRYNQLSVSGDDLWFGNQFDLQGLRIDHSLDSGEQMGAFEDNFLTIGTGVSAYYRWTSKDAVAVSISVNNINSPAVGLTETTSTLQPLMAIEASQHHHLDKDIIQKAGFTFLQQGQVHRFIPHYQLSLEFNRDDSTMDLGVATDLGNHTGGYRLQGLHLIFGLRYSAYGFRFNYTFDLSRASDVSSGNGGFALTLSYNPVKPPVR